MAIRMLLHDSMISFVDRVAKNFILAHYDAELKVAGTIPLKPRQEQKPINHYFTTLQNHIQLKANSLK